MLTAAGITALVAMCIRLECDPVDLISVAANESGIKTTAHNSHGDASGIWQLMPATARGLGWDVANDPHLDKFRALCDVEQMEWFEKYFKPETGKLVSETAAYMATFCPAWISHYGEPHFVICGADGRSDGGLHPRQSVAWYHANIGFDVHRRGWIIVQDLTDAIDRATKDLGSKWIELVQAIRAEQAKPTEPDAA